MSHAPNTIAAPAPPSVAVAGILSRTVFQSPIVERILSGRIRNTGYKDAIFVGKDIVDVKELSHDGQLCTVATLTGFGSRIVTAQIIGNRSSLTSTTQESKSVVENGDHVPLGALSQPSHALVLLFETGDLLFLTMSLDANQEWQFQHVRYPLDLATDDLERWRFIAVEPDSRVMAVASVSGRVSLLALSGPSQVKNAFRFDSGISILLMDFIFSSANDASVYLMLVGRKQHRFCCVVYAWDLQRPFTDPEPYCYTLDAQHPPPSMLIPLPSYPGGFVLGALQKLTVYKNAHVRSIQKCAGSTDLPIFVSEQSHNPESMYEQPPWINWARASRWYTNSDCFYVSREDGIVYNVQIGTSVESLSRNPPASSEELTFVRSGMPHPLRGNIGSAFATYDPEHGTGLGPDIILFAGDLSDGAHYEIGQRKRLEGRHIPEKELLYWRETDSFYNWAPFLAVAVVPPPTTIAKDPSRPAFKSRSEYNLHERTRVFGTSGKGAWGAVTELRMGWEFTVTQTLLPQDQLQGANKAWSMRNTAVGWKFDFISTPFSTVAINWTTDSVHLETISADPTLEMALLKVPGKAGIQQSIILQVTSHGTLMLAAEEYDDMDSEQGFLLKEVQNWKDEAIIASAIDTVTGIVVLGVRENGRIMLKVKRLTYNSETNWALEQLGEAIPLSDVPTCIDIFASHSSYDLVKQEDSKVLNLPIQFVAIGTDIGNMLCFRLDLNDGLQYLSEHPLVSETACESLYVISSPHWPGFRGVCGLRNGTIIVFSMTIEDQYIVFPTQQQKTFYMGCTSPSVKLSQDDTGPGCYIYGSADTCYLDLSNARLEEVTLNNVWLTDRANRSLNQHPMAAICQVSYSVDDDQRTDKLLLLDARAQVYFGSLSKKIEPLPRRIPVIGTPNRLIYSNYLQCLIVASTVTEIDAASHVRYESSVVSLVDPEGEAEESDTEESNGVIGVPNSGSQMIYYLDHVAERIQSLTEWQVAKGDSKHHFIVVGTSVRESSGESSGFIHLLQYRLTTSGTRSLKLVKSCRESRPVGAVCAWDDKTLLYCAGDQIRKRTVAYEGHDIGLVKTRLFQMQSAGVYLDHCRDFASGGHLVSVTSLQGSTRLLKFNDDESILVSFASDSKSRPGLCHAILPSGALVLSSSKDQTVTGIPIPGHTRLQHASTPLFECKLSASITRFVHGPIRPPWKQQSTASADDIIGVATDGSLLSFRLLGEHPWRLLRFVANMAMRDARLCRLEQIRPALLQRGHIEPLASDPGAHHVDGDLLARLLSVHDAHGMLNELLAKTPMEAPAFTGRGDMLATIDFESAQARRIRFEELVEEALWSLVETEGLDAQQEVARAGEDPVLWTVQYMKRILELPF